MKQGLSLRVSQHLALTPQLQQSIRLLQLSTLELGQEVEQMLDENPFLDRQDEAAEREAFGLEVADAPVSLGDAVSEFESEKVAKNIDEISDEGVFSLKNKPESAADDRGPASDDAGPGGTEGADGVDGADWSGDGTVDMRADDSEWGGEAPARGTGASDGDDTVSAIDLAQAHISLQDHLHRQALGLRLNAEEQAALYALIESLDENGYLADPLADLAASFEPGDPQDPEVQERRETTEQVLRTALGWLQSMDPPGVGARDVAECLRLQIQEMRNTPAARAAMAICEQPLELMARRDVRKLSTACGLEEALVREALALIVRLEPRPGRRFANLEGQVVVPDVLVTRVGRGFKVQLNPEVMPRLRVHDVYANAMREGRGAKGADGGGMQQRLQEARWFIKNIQQRFDTILRVSSAIVERQRNFFMHGELAMRPLVLREIADELGLHESTISRVTTAKYMATPFGTYELKYFFGSSLGTETGGNASSTAVRALIKQLVAGEDPKKPLSDNALSDMLKEQGIECARRTVAKYREALKIAPASLRKAL